MSRQDRASGRQAGLLVGETPCELVSEQRLSDVRRGSLTGEGEGEGEGGSGRVFFFFLCHTAPDI